MTDAGRIMTGLFSDACRMAEVILILLLNGRMYVPVKLIDV